MKKNKLISCHHCGAVLRIPENGSGDLACPRCEGRLARGSGSHHWCLALSLSALFLFPFAITEPIMRIRRFGNVSEASALEGATSMLAHEQWLVGGVVLLCSVVIPGLKLLGLFTLCARFRLPRKHLARTWQLVEWTGRWGMVDVLLVAVLVSAVKMGDWFDVRPGKGAVLFTLMVCFSLAASACFHPADFWERSDD